jgi:hypothetical protein
MSIVSYWDTTHLYVISGFRHKVHENCDILGHYVEKSVHSLPTFRDNLLGPSSRVEESGCPETSVRNSHYSLLNSPEERSTHDSLSFILPEGLGTDISEKRDESSFRVEDGDNKVSPKRSYLATTLYGVKSKIEIFKCWTNLVACEIWYVEQAGDSNGLGVVKIQKMWDLQMGWVGRGDTDFQYEVPKKYYLVPGCSTIHSTRWDPFSEGRVGIKKAGPSKPAAVWTRFELQIQYSISTKRRNTLMGISFILGKRKATCYKCNLTFWHRSFTFKF